MLIAKILWSMLCRLDLAIIFWVFLSIHTHSLIYDLFHHTHTASICMDNPTMESMWDSSDNDGCHIMWTVFIIRLLLWILITWYDDLPTKDFCLCKIRYILASICLLNLVEILHCIYTLRNKEIPSKKKKEIAKKYNKTAKTPEVFEAAISFPFLPVERERERERRIGGNFERGEGVISEMQTISFGGLSVEKGNSLLSLCLNFKNLNHPFYSLSKISHLGVPTSLSSSSPTKSGWGGSSRAIKNFHFLFLSKCLVCHPW